MATINSIETEVLRDFYIDAGGDNWRWHTNYALFGVPWNFSQPSPNPCLQRWQGILCNVDCNSTSYCTIISITLEDFYMYGGIPASIGNLTSLEVFSIHKNGIMSIIPSTFSNIKGLKVFDIGLNNIQGQLPHSFSALTKLMYLDITNNRLTGNCLEVISTYLTKLIYLDISNNKFTGTIPTALGSFKNLTHLGMSSTLLHGTIPPELGNLHNLTFFNLATNYQLQGSIPDSVGNLLELQYLKLFSTSLTGTFPLSLQNLTKLTYLNLGYNARMDSTIRIASSNMLTNSKKLISLEVAHVLLPPDFLVTMSTSLLKLQRLNLAATGLEGAIPDTFAQLIHLHIVDLSNNSLTGTIPSYYHIFPNLSYLNLSYNCFSNTIPSYIFTLQRLKDIDFSANFFIGTIPHTLNESQLSTLYIQYNALTGSIPPSISAIKTIGYCFLAHNFLTGSIPPTFLSKTTLVSVYLENNFLTGTIATIENVGHNAIYRLNLSSNYLFGNLTHTNVGSMRQLGILDLSKNLLSSTLHHVFTTTARELQYIILRENFFTGSLDFLTSTPLFHQVIVMDISDNQLTGAFTDNITQALRQMSIFAAVKNCITGTIPESLCAQHELITLALDGLTSATVCQAPFFAPWAKISSYRLRESHGKLPECLFTMPNLQTLHLSGNGLEGTIPNNISTQLTDLSLSYNQLTGTIPTSLQQRLGNSSSIVVYPMKLDLAFNKLTGSLLNPAFYYKNDALAANRTSTSGFYETVSLEINRISGKLPNGYLHLTNVNILRGNIFDCSSTDGNGLVTTPSALPDADGYRTAYDCGSNNVNLSLMIWLILGMSIASVVLCGYCIYRLTTRKIGKLSVVKCEINESSSVEIIAGKLEDQTNLSSKLNLPTQICNCMGDIEQLVLDIGKNFQECFAVYSIPLTADDVELCSSLSSANTPSMTHVHKFILIEFAFCLKLVCRIIATLAMAILITLLPVYIALHFYYSTYEYTYTWMISLGYLAGIFPAYFLFFLFLVMILLFVHWMRLWVISTHHAHSRQTETSSAKSAEKASINQNDDNTDSNIGHVLWSDWWKVIIVSVWNVLIVVSVNIAYVYMINTMKLSNTDKFFVSITLSIFKIVWGHVVVLDWFVNYLDNDEGSSCNLLRLFGSTPQHAESSSVENDSHPKVVDCNKMTLKTRFLTILFLFNNILAPILADTLINSNCFYYLFIQAPVVSVSYSACDGSTFIDGPLKTVCLVQASLSSAYNGVYTGSTSYTPPFVYNYQCSSSILTDFVTIFIYRYVISGLLVPVIHWISYGFFLLRQQRISVLNDHQDKMCYNKVHDLLLQVFLPKPLRLIFQHEHCKHLNDCRTKPQSVNINSPASEVVLNTIHQSTNIASTQEGIDHSVEVRKDPLLPAVILPHQLVLFDKLAFLVKLINDVAVMLTFGVAFPLLAVIIAVSIILNVFHWQLILGKFLLFARSKRTLYLPSDRKPPSDLACYECSYPNLLFILAHNISHLLHLFWKKVGVLIVIPSWFLACFLLDILGDAVGVMNALWIFIVMGMFPCLYWIVLQQWSKSGKPVLKRMITSTKQTSSIPAHQQIIIEHDSSSNDEEAIVMQQLPSFSMN